jgi:hypothetical protein
MLAMSTARRAIYGGPFAPFSGGLADAQRWRIRKTSDWYSKGAIMEPQELAAVGFGNNGPDRVPVFNGTSRKRLHNTLPCRAIRSRPNKREEDSRKKTA